MITINPNKINLILLLLNYYTNTLFDTFWNLIFKLIAFDIIQFIPCNYFCTVSVFPSLTKLLISFQIFTITNICKCYTNRYYYLASPHAILKAHFDTCSRKMISFSVSATFSNSFVNIKDCSTNISKNLRNVFALKLGAIIFRFLVHIDAEINRGI